MYTLGRYGFGGKLGENLIDVIRGRRIREKQRKQKEALEENNYRKWMEVLME